MSDNFSDVNELFDDIEKHFEESKNKNKKLMVVATLGVVTSLVLLVAGLSVSFWISVAGYVGLLASVVALVNLLRGNFALSSLPGLFSLKEVNMRNILRNKRPDQ